MKKAKFIHLISLLLTLSMLIGIMPTSVFAATDSGVTVEETPKATTVAEAQSNSSGSQLGIGSTKYFTVRSKNYSLHYKYNGKSNTRTGGVFWLDGVTPTDPKDLTLLGDSVFCSQHFNKTPADKSKFTLVGTMSETSIKFTDDLNSDKAYRIIKAAQAVLKEDSRYQSDLTVQQITYAVQQVLHSPEEFMKRLCYGVAGGNFTANQAKLFGELYKAIYDKFHTSAYYNFTVPVKQSLTAVPSGGNRFSGSDYVLATYTLNMSGVTATVNSGSTSGVTASVTGSTLTISIPASKMPTSGNISWNVSLTAANQILETVNIYTSGVNGKQQLMMLEEEYYTATATVPGSIPRYETGSVEVTKIDATNPNTKLAGAVFIIVNKDTGEIIPLPKTDSNGYTSLEQLKIGRYTITESIAPDGYARSNWSQDFEITADSTTTLSYTVENRPASASWTPSINKWEIYYQSLESPNHDYTFELLQDGVVIQTVSTHQINSWWGYYCHKYTFAPITFSKEDEGKEFHFTIREKDTGIPGVVYNPGHLDITLKVKDVSATLAKDQFDITYEPSDTVTSLSSGSSEYVFVNYIPAEASWTPTVTKQFTNGTLKDGQFTFALYEDGQELQRVTNRADGSIPFTAIKYTVDDIGTHTYTIREIAGNDSDIRYDTHEVTMVVEVSFPIPTIQNSISLDQDISLRVTHKETVGSTVFNNTVEKRGSWMPTVFKQVTGSTLNVGQFTFALFDENGDLIQMVANDPSGKVTFDTIHYTLDDIGTHTYTIEEWTDGQDGWVYDLHKVTYTVTVAEGSSSLVVTPTTSDSTTFTNRYETISIRVEKLWNDNNNANGKRQDATFTLYGSNGNMITFTIPVGQSSYIVTGVPKYNLDGAEITYTISEIDMETYTSDVKVVENSADGYRYVFTVTNTELTDVTVTKVWNDKNQTALRKDVQLTLTGSDGQTYTGTIPVGETTYIFEYLPVYMADGKTKVEYTLTEASIDGYSGRIDVDSTGYNFTVTNTPIDDLTEYTVYKIWNDDGNRDGKRPSEITVTIKGSDGSTYSATFGGTGDDWSYTFTELPKYGNSDELISYSIESENAVPGYTPSIDGNTITNTYVPEKTTFTVYKKWVDNGDQDGVRPAQITVTIKGSDGNTYTATFGGSGDDWSYTFEDLPMYNDGKLIVYSIVSEDAVLGYTASIKGNTITNTHEPDLISVTATKVWDDNNNQDGLRTDVHLTLTGSNGNTYTGVIRLGDTSYTWTDLPVYFNGGQKIVYTLIETKIDGYDTEIVKGESGYTFVVTNTHEPYVTDITATKVWEDGNDQDGLRADVHLTLTGSDGNKRSGIIRKGETSFKWTDLPIYMDDGQLIRYTLTEAKIEGYYSEIAVDGYSFTVTNTHVPEKIEIPIRKVWEDYGNEWNVRPDNITVVLYGSDGSERMATIRATDKWVYTFQNLPKYWNNGERIEYTLSELPVHGYTTEIVKGEDRYSFTVSNTLVFGRLHIIKNAEDGFTEGLRFRIYGVSHQGTTVDIVAATGADGVARVDYILSGYYYVEEIDIPDRYVAPDRQTVIVVGDNSNPEITVMSFYNELKRMSVVVNKTAEDGILSGHTFRIEGIDYLDNKIDLVGVTDEDGVVVFGDLLAGDYVITELGTDIRYVVPEGQNVELIWGKDENVNFHNSLKRMSITIHKTAEDDVLKDHLFHLVGTDYMGNEIDLIGKTDEHGIIIFEGLLAGNYEIIEEDTDIRYVVPDGQNIELTWEKDVNVNFHNTLKRMCVTIHKTAEDDIIKGHKFRLVGTDYLGNEIDIMGESDKSGIVIFENLLSGNYVITEENTGIQYVVPDDQIIDLMWGEDVSVSFENLLKYWRLTIRKTDAATGKPVAGAVYGINKDGVLLDEYTTDENGSFTTFEYLCGEGYTLREVLPAPGFTLDAVEYALDGARPEHCTLIISELGIDVTDTPTHIEITKTDITTDDPVMGAEIVIYNADGNEVFRGITDENGKLEAFYLPVGVYTFVEIVPASGYTLNPNRFVFEIYADGSIVGDTEFSDKPTHVKITKTDITTSKPLPGAEITIYDADGNEVFRGLTNENGEIDAYYLPVGVYAFRETYSPDGFMINETIFSFEIHADGRVTGDTEIKDEPYTVTLKKLESTSKTPVQGAVIEMYGEDGSLIGQFITDKNGEIFLREMLPGIYSYKEISAPDGYELDDALHTFTMNKDGSVSGETTFYNARIEPTVPKTGDNSQLLGSFALLSLIATVLFIYKRKRQG